MRLVKQLFWVFLTLGILLGVMELFLYDVIKIDWVSFMEIQPAHNAMEDPLPVPPRSIPVEGPAYILALGAPTNPTLADEASVTRGGQLFSAHCQMCHGATGTGNGPVAPFLIQFKPADLTSIVSQSKSDGSIFLTITNGVDGRMPALNENLNVADRWDVVNFVRTLKKAE